MSKDAPSESSSIASKDLDSTGILFNDFWVFSYSHLLVKIINIYFLCLTYIFLLSTFAQADTL